MLWFAGDVRLTGDDGDDSADVTTLLDYCASRRAARAPAQSRTSTRAHRARFGPVKPATILYAVDTDTGWNRTAPAAPGTAAFCDNQSASAWYIKVGGDRSVASGWDGGRADKCCRSSPAACRWFGSQGACDATLSAGALEHCLACSSAGDESIGCPQWASVDSQAELQTIAELGPATDAVVSVGIEGGGDGGAGEAPPTRATAAPAVLRHRVGNGSVITLLVNDPGWERILGLQEHVMSRLADNASPFELLARDGTDARLEVAVSMARSHRGWIVTLVNSNGVTKQPSLPAVTNASAAVAISLACKPEYGRLGAASVMSHTWLTCSDRLRRPGAGDRWCCAPHNSSGRSGGGGRHLGLIHGHSLKYRP